MSSPPGIGTAAALFAAARYPGRLRSLVAGSGAAAVPLQLGGMVKDIVEAPDLDGFRRADPRQPVSTALSGIRRYTLPESVRDDYLASYPGDRFAGSVRFLRYYPAELPVLAGLLPQIDTPEAEASRLIADTTDPAAHGDGQRLTGTAWATAVLNNGLSRYDEALTAAEQASEDPDELGLATWALSELIEAAARTGALERASGALRRLSEATSAAATDWALGIQGRSRALLSGVEHAERLYLEAIERLGPTRIRAELARAHLLYGEWLRRQGRRRDAREQQRTAYQMPAAMGTAGFAERARKELAATGETARKRTIETVDELTAQEAQIARPARNGCSNPKISTSCSSARVRSNGICARSSPSSVSAPGRNSAPPGPTSTWSPCPPSLPVGQTEPAPCGHRKI